MHAMSANLHLHDLAIRPDHGRMQRLVAILLGVGYVVIKLIRDVAPKRVHNSEGGITILHLRHENTHGPDIVYLGKIEALDAHLPPDAVDVFGTARKVGFDTGSFQL